jgi:hypothetical protein
MSREALQDLIDSLPAHWRVKVAAMLANSGLRGWLVQTADTAIVELTRQTPYVDIAKQLEVSVGMVNRRVSRHRKRNREVG